MRVKHDTSDSRSRSRNRSWAGAALLGAFVTACGPGGEAPAKARAQPETKAKTTASPDAKAGADAKASPPAAKADVALTVQDVGFMAPESALHDPTSDLYLVSNIEGGPGEEDGNGFISRVSTDGAVQNLKWIDGFGDGVTLNAPKGMAIVGETLYVADIDHVRKFDRRAGTPAGSITIEGAKFLNDVAPALAEDEGAAVYVSDTADDVVYRIGADDAVTPMVRGEALAGPNGLCASPRGLIMVNRAGGVFRLTAGGPQRLATAPAGGLDGVVAWEAGGGLLVSSWEGEAVYRVDLSAGAGSDAAVTTVFGAGEGGALASPADIGFDARRQRLLIPQLKENKLLIRPVAAP